MATKSTRNINTKPVVVKKPTGRTGGTNPSVSAVKSPTKYTGGKMAPPKNAVPAGKGVTNSTMSKAKMGGSYKKGGMVKSMKKK